MIDLYNGDCLEVMKNIPDKSVDLVLTDPPYGTTACKWDSVIPFEPMWEQLKRVVKVNGVIVLFGSEPFSSSLRMSNINQYGYDWIWNKKKAGNIFTAKSQPMKVHETISVFFNRLNDTIGNNCIFDGLKQYLNEEREKTQLTTSQIKNLINNFMCSHYFTKGIQWSLPSKKDYEKLQTTGFFGKDWEDLKDEYERLKKQTVTSKVVYFPQMTKRDKVKKSKNYGTGEVMGGDRHKENKAYTYTEKNPISILEFSNAFQKGKQHPTQKPVALLEYLIKTYTNENEMVLDFTMGSGSTGVACKNTNRSFIGIELDSEYFEIAKNRIKNN